MSNTAAQVVALFGAGVASFLAPCIVPLVPAYLGIIVGEVGDAHDPARAVPATLLFIAGFTTVFAGLGATAGLLGSSLSTFQTWVRIGGGVVIIVMGFALLGVLRGPLSRERRLIPTLPKVTGVLRPYVVGIAFGAGWSPCVGPLLAAALTIAARSQEIGRGTLLLSAYAAGIGVPFLLAALGLASSPSLAARSASGRSDTRTHRRIPTRRPRHPARQRYLRAPHVVPRPLRPRRTRTLTIGRSRCADRKGGCASVRSAPLPLPALVTNLASTEPRSRLGGCALYLYAAYLGGDLADGRMGEDHEVVFVVGSNTADVRRRARAKWSGHGSAHIDAIQRLDRIDGFEVALNEVGGDDQTTLDNNYDPADDDE